MRVHRKSGSVFFAKDTTDAKKNMAAFLAVIAFLETYCHLKQGQRKVLKFCLKL